MNPRIRVLAHEAGLPTYNPDGIPTKLEKFAELIVRECVKIANSGIDPAESHLIGNDILEHFGVDQ
jgi:hypothetical protein